MVQRPAQRRLKASGADSGHALASRRDVYFTEVGGMVACGVYDRYRLQAGNRVQGPAIIEEKDSTTVLHPGYAATVDTSGNMLIEEVRV
jgi:N-methylhydantoinase A